MNRILLLAIYLIVVPFSCFASYPKAHNEYVNDYADVIDFELVKELRETLKNVEYYSGVEITVLTIENYSVYKTGDYSWEAFTTALFNHWGVGNQDQNNGVLFLISTGDQRIRIELGAGYPDHYDTIMQSILDNDIVPLLKNNNFPEGIARGVEKIVAATTVKISFFEWYKWYILGGIMTIIVLIIAFIIDKKNNLGIFWGLISVAGLLTIWIFKGLANGNRSDGFGGGHSDGGGASGDFGSGDSGSGGSE
ncbi:MAG: TPM domain-containing protein [Thiotrichaceae bacterium]|nr:TPM domain-containing protein [Thiotrichaceae bacterium]